VGALLWTQKKGAPEGTTRHALRLALPLRCQHSRDRGRLCVCFLKIFHVQVFIEPTGDGDACVSQKRGGQGDVPPSGEGGRGDGQSLESVSGVNAAGSLAEFFDWIIKGV